MSIEDIIWLAFYIIMLVQIIAVIIWRICCFFKKTCHWKRCPYHQNYFRRSGFGMPGCVCKKFPPTQEELDEQDQLLEKLLENLLKK